METIIHCRENKLFLLVKNNFCYHLLLAGTYSTQPAVTTQTFGHKYGGFIYAFLFSCDIINNFLVATLSTVGHWSLQSMFR